MMLSGLAALLPILYVPAHAQAPAIGVAQDLPPRVAQALIDAGIPLTSTGTLVRELSNPEAVPWIAVNVEVPFNPASTIKLVTTFAALELLGPAFTWKTIAASTASTHDGKLDGDLVIKGAGDPKLDMEGFWMLLRQLRQQGVRRIDGDLVLDRSLFAPQVHDPAAFDGEPYRPYNVGPDALLVHYKSINIRFTPDAQRRRVDLWVEPRLGGLRLGPVRYLDGPCGDWRASLALDVRDARHLRFAGGFPGACGEKTLGVSLHDHAEYVGLLFRLLWEELGGTWHGKVRDGTLPPDARVLATHESPSLAEITRDINKHSNNVMARELYLSLAAYLLHVPADTERAGRLVRTFLSWRGLDMPELVLENGSGLSRNERISAGSLGRLLVAAWAAPTMPEFVSSLPLAGLDGTMQRRLNEDSMAGYAHMKTGSLAGVRAMAGYVLAASGKRYAVVSIVNDPNAGAARAMQDELLKWVREQG